MYEGMSKLFTLIVKADHVDSTRVVIRAHDANRFHPSHHQVDIEVRMGGKVIFPRGSLYCGIPQHHTIDGEYAKETVLATVAMKPGDTEAEYFDSYTPEQLAFAEAYGEELSVVAEERYGRGR